jgi:hypothetical protein
MAASCGKCGEELLGAVNRCWRCGHVFDGLPGEDGQPPVRHSAQTLWHNHYQQQLQQEFFGDEF